MKKAKLGDYLLWKGAIAKIVAEINERAVVIQMNQHAKCPHCGGDLGVDQSVVIPTSPLFEENAEPVPTIEI